ncbi:uncharacterized protein N7484_009836 [Penicillium longicatenatum]|uniref:uncharacterized protein n=1 Tax=Penicillium longicatenatum TaxID=1561947 RepID=UPI002547913A|nr:uncharacterized protein N7484_009836 [Penicillium longicatenatum]KAJ5636523.1 hypothetical protein N7484_009836 [Penicillium longicatenatum]
MSGPFRIVIAGGGIAGLSAAIALRGPNRQITVLEQSSLCKEIRALISLQPNASKILQSNWDLKNELHNAREMVDEGFRIHNTDGTLVNTIPLLAKPEYGSDRLLFHRKDLHDVLKDADVSPDREGGACHLAASIAGIVTLETGERIKADSIIGADGIHSVLRKYVLGSEPCAMPTGHSGGLLKSYRLMIPSDILEGKEPQFCAKINLRDPFTSMIVAHDCHMIIGPRRQGECLMVSHVIDLMIFWIIAADHHRPMNEDPHAKQSWVSKGDLEKMKKTFANFPTWVTDIFKHSPDLGLWQLRDLDPLVTWHRGRVILIGDATHDMLPTQGQGASQAIEDAEALGAFFEDVTEAPPFHSLTETLEDIFQSRYTRVSLIQAYSRQAAKPATDKGAKVVNMKPDEFMDYNCKYSGAKQWRLEQLAN